MRGKRRATTAVGRVIGYTRVSSQKQDRDGTSLEGQQASIARWIRAEGLPPPARVAIEVESGAAEKIEKRTEQRSIEREAQAGDTIVVAAVDRWSRDIVHSVSTVRALVARGVRWYAIRENLDATTREGEERLGLMAWVADSERRRIRDRTIGRKVELQDEGMYVLGQAPTGYAIVERRLVPGPEADIVRQIFALCAAGEGLHRIAQLVPLPKGRKGWDKSGIHRVLRNRMHLGELQNSDGVWRPTHEPLVDRDTWDRAHAALAARKLAGRPHGERLLRGLAWCSLCGRRISVVLGRERQDGGRTAAYVCARKLVGLCKARTVHAERLDALVAQALERRLVELRHEIAKAPSAQREVEAPAVNHAAALARARRKRERLISLAVDGTITKEDLRERLAKLDLEIGKIEGAAATARRKLAAAERTRLPEQRAEILERVETIIEAWERTPPDGRRRLLAIFAARVEVVPGPRARSHDVVAPRIRWRPLAELTADI